MIASVDIKYVTRDKHVLYMLGERICVQFRTLYGDTIYLEEKRDSMVVLTSLETTTSAQTALAATEIGVCKVIR